MANPVLEQNNQKQPSKIKLSTATKSKVKKINKLKDSTKATLEKNSSTISSSDLTLSEHEDEQKELADLSEIMRGLKEQLSRVKPAKNTLDEACTDKEAQRKKTTTSPDSGILSRSNSKTSKKSGSRSSLKSKEDHNPSSRSSSKASDKSNKSDGKTKDFEKKKNKEDTFKIENECGKTQDGKVLVKMNDKFTKRRMSQYTSSPDKQTQLYNLRLEERRAYFIENMLQDTETKRDTDLENEIKERDQREQQMREDITKNKRKERLENITKEIRAHIQENLKLKMQTLSKRARDTDSQSVSGNTTHRTEVTPISIRPENDQNNIV